MEQLRNVILEEIADEELNKLNYMSFYLSQMPESSKVVRHPKDKAKSTFNNASDIACWRFYKNPSLIINLDD